MSEKKREQLDSEWISLLKAAKEMGLRPEDIRNFLRKEAVAKKN
ncbi:anti-repressor SinI family protein [Aneurinibacillus sp. BA2021]|nr:anti-repressor SinI family protein [Aneurinibacillus sp. BA2021]